jgi:nitrogen-specific signal transduction histidine kinase
VIDASCVVSAVPDDSGQITALRGQLLDVSEQRRFQMQLAGAARMELFGRFAGALAHDFNNLLITISGNAERLARELSASTPLHVCASEICDASGRATALTHQLLAFSRRQVFELQQVDMARLIEDSRPELERLLGPDVSVRVELASSVPSIEADAAQLRSVLTNLAANAREAMAGRGTLTLKVDSWVVNEPVPDKGWLRPGNYARLMVTDTGTGMDAVARGLAFQPFFSTKGLGNGRGLGLAMVYGIVKQSRGFIWVESESGRGATFTVLFPVTGHRMVRADETVLLIEPEDQLRAMIGEVLRGRGYELLEAASIEAALSIFASRSGDIELVIASDGCDAGADRPLLPRLRAVNPAIQVLVMGDAEGDSIPRVLPTTPLIRKPFTLKALADHVRAVLDSGEGRN